MDKNIQYRLLNEGEEIKATDEFRGSMGVWRFAPDHFIGKPWRHYHVSFRRRCYEAELLNAFKEIRDEHWQGLPGKAGDLILATIALAEGRAE